MVSLVTLLLIQGFSSQVWGDEAKTTSKRGIWGWKSETRSRDATERAAKDAAKKGGVSEADAERAVHVLDKRGKLNRLTGGLLGTKSKIVTDKDGNVIYRKDRGLFGKTYKERVYTTEKDASGKITKETRVDKVRSLDPEYQRYEKQTKYKVDEDGNREKIQSEHIKVWHVLGRDGKPIESLEKSSEYGVASGSGPQRKNSVSGGIDGDAERKALWERTGKRLGKSGASASTQGGSPGQSSSRPSGSAVSAAVPHGGGQDRRGSPRATPFEEARAEARKAEDDFNLKGRELEKLRQEHEKTKGEATAADGRVAQLQAQIDEKKNLAKNAEKALNDRSSPQDRLNVAKMREELADLNDGLSAARSHAGTVSAKVASAAAAADKLEQDHKALKVLLDRAIHGQKVAKSDETLAAQTSRLEELKLKREAKVQEHQQQGTAKAEELDGARAKLQALKDEKRGAADKDLGRGERERTRALILKREVELDLLKEKHENELRELDGSISTAEGAVKAARQERENLKLEEDNLGE